MNGALLVDKPAGPTSHDIVAFARRVLQTPAIGHTGTLDPLATGLIVLLVGHATRLSRFLVTDEKEYIADVRLGQSTPTYDAQGLDRPSADGGTPPPGASDPAAMTPGSIQSVLAGFRGTFSQVPPAFSAKKVDGVRSYEKARRHEPVELKPVIVTVSELELLGHAAPSSGLSPDASLLRLRLVCSSGFYVRSLAHDIGQALGCGAHLERLRRTRAGQFHVRDALTLDLFEPLGAAAGSRLVGVNALLAGMPAATLSEEGNRRAGNGNTVAPTHLQGTLPDLLPSARVRLLTPSGAVLGVAEWRTDGLLHPLVVLR